VESHWRIKEFASRTGVPEATLRAWERRYELLDPGRTPGGYRLYSPADERRVVAMQAHMSRGIAAAEASALALAEARPVLDAPEDPRALAEALLEAIADFDATRADLMLESALRHGPSVAIRDVVMPAMHELGERWAQGVLTVAHEHFATHLVERRLLTLSAGWDAGPGPRALLACPSGERHTLGLLCFGVALAEREWSVSYLGADTPIEHVARAAAGLSADVVVLSAVEPARLAENAESIRSLSGEVRTLLAGAGATPAVVERLGVERIVLDPVSAADALAP